MAQKSTNKIKYKKQQKEYIEDGFKTFFCTDFILMFNRSHIFDFIFQHIEFSEVVRRYWRILSLTSQQQAGPWIFLRRGETSQNAMQGIQLKPAITMKNYFYMGCNVIVFVSFFSRALVFLNETHA